jgi:sigma-B regulation protein RsbU (phosphoserine phosphatase)
LQAGVVVLAVAAARRLSSQRFAPTLAGALTALLYGAPSFEPWTAGLVASLVMAAGLVFTHQKFGLTALLVAAFNSLCLPLAFFAARQPDWLIPALAVYGLSSLALLSIGAVALGKREEPTSERAGVPRFVRRLEEERRLRYEMDLLARMQLGLLPSTLPTVPGWTIAARSLLANEVGGDLYDFVHDERGRLWIAAGDVAGHGFSCAITQAMTKAALVSLVYSGTTPSEVLLEIDRVLRTGGSERSFVSLLLVRFDPASGEALVANAGHPYPLLCGRSGVRELNLPGLPLGRGPVRSYEDLALTIEPGEALVIASDGLFEALDERDESYGFDRAAALLAGENAASSQELLERVVADWSSFRGARPAADDTTLVVLRRALPGEV